MMEKTDGAEVKLSGKMGDEKSGQDNAALRHARRSEKAMGSILSLSGEIRKTCIVCSETQSHEIANALLNDNTFRLRRKEALALRMESAGMGSFGFREKAERVAADVLNALRATISDVYGKKKLEEEPCGAGIAGLFKNYSIVVVDDNELNSEFFKTLLRLKYGINEKNIHCAKSGMESLEIVSALAAESKRTLVFMDYNMPSMNGCETSEKLLDALGGATRIIGVTAWSKSEVKFPKGVPVIAKPLEKEELEMAVKTVLVN